MTDYAKWAKLEKDLAEEDEKEMQQAAEKQHLLETEVIKALKDQGNAHFKKNELAAAVGKYTDCIVLLTGCRDPRSKPKPAPQPAQEPPPKPLNEKAKDVGVDLPAGVTAIDPTQMQQQVDTSEPMDEMGQAREGYGIDVPDQVMQARMELAQARLMKYPELRELLAQCLANGAWCKLQLSEGKDAAFKEKIVESPGGVDKWDSYRVRMTVDALNDARQAIMYNPTYARAWYRIGYAIQRLIFLIDRIRERKPWLREEELPILEKPQLWAEARVSLQRALELDPDQATHKKLCEVQESMTRMTTIVRKLGHENLQCELDDNLVLTSVDEGGPSKKWGLEHFIGFKLTHCKIGDDGPMLPVNDLEELVDRQTHASLVTLTFDYTSKEKLPDIPPWSHYDPNPGSKDKDSPDASPSPPANSKWGPPPPKKKKRKTNPLLLPVAAFGLLLAILLYYVLGSS